MRHILKKAEPIELELPGGEVRRLFRRHEMNVKVSRQLDDIDVNGATTTEEKFDRLFAQYSMMIPGLTRGEFEELSTFDFSQIGELFSDPLVKTPPGNPAPSGDETGTSSG